MNFNVIFGILGGLGLFLFGIKLMGDSLRRLSLGLLKKLIEKLTSNRVKSALLGTLITSIIQSSSATSVLLIGFLNAGLISLTSALPVIFGANIGTTITAQLIAFKLTKSALIFIFIGATVNLFAKKDKNKTKGTALLGFGIIFLGLSTMSAAVKPLAGNESIIHFFINFGQYPVLGIFTGLLVTLLLQSSSTTVGMVIAFASAGLLDLESSLFLVIGDNIGTCITALLASIGGKLSSKRLALGHALFNIFGTLIIIPMIPLYLKFIPLMSGDIARQIANIHTIFNIVNTIILLPLVPFFIAILMKLVPGTDYEKIEARFLDDNLLVTPELAIKAVLKELCAMIDICKDMLDKSIRCIMNYNHKLKNETLIDEESLDEMQKIITEYIVKITKCDLTDKERRILPALLHSVNDLEKVGDHCEDFVRLSQRLFEEELSFSDFAQDELEKLFGKTAKLMDLTKKAMQNDDHDAARITLTIDMEIGDLILQYKFNHVRRLGEGTCASDAGLVYSDILTDIGRLNDHLCNITKGILHIGKR